MEGDFSQSNYNWILVLTGLQSQETPRCRLIVHTVWSAHKYQAVEHSWERSQVWSCSYSLERPYTVWTKGYSLGPAHKIGTVRGEFKASRHYIYKRLTIRISTFAQPATLPTGFFNPRRLVAAVDTDLNYSEILGAPNAERTSKHLPYKY